MTKPYETQAAPIAAECPKHLAGKTAQEIVDYLSDHFSATEIIDPATGHLVGWHPENKATAYMMAVSNALFNQADWKGPLKAWFPVCGQEWAKAAIIWYHGSTPIQNGYWVYSSGYAC